MERDLRPGKPKLGLLWSFRESCGRVCKAMLSTQDSPEPSSEHKGDSFAPEGQRARNKRQGREKGEGARQRREGYWSQREGTNDCLWIDRRQTWPIGK